jgi:hypothetical protein
MTLKDNLIAAKALIDTPAKWAKGPAPWGDDRRCAEQALCYRGHGAFDAVAKAIPLGWKVRQWLRGRWSILSSANIIRYNDAPGTTHADIMALFDCAIEAAS